MQCRVHFVVDRADFTSTRMIVTNRALCMLTVTG